MESISKTPVSPETMQEIAARHLGQPLRSVTELREGWFNAAFLLELDGGQKYVLKVAPPPDVKVLRYEKDIMTAEVESMRLVKARTSVPVPNIVAHDTSHSLLKSDFFIMDFMPGPIYHQVRKDFPPADQAGLDRQIGGFLRQINDISGDGFGYAAPGNARFTRWRECFDAMITGVLQDGQAAKVDLRLPYDALHAGLARHFDTLDEVESAQLVHWDLWDLNIFIDLETKQVTGIIDFERTLWGDPLMEANFCDIALHDGFMEGYGRDMLDTPARRQRRLLYNVYLYLIMIIESAYRHYETDDLENFARAQLANDLGQLGVS